MAARRSDDSSALPGGVSREFLVERLAKLRGGDDEAWAWGFAAIRGAGLNAYLEHIAMRVRDTHPLDVACEDLADAGLDFEAWQSRAAIHAIANVWRQAAAASDPSSREAVAVNFAACALDEVAERNMNAVAVAERVDFVRADEWLSNLALGWEQACAGNFEADWWKENELLVASAVGMSLASDPEVDLLGDDEVDEGFGPAKQEGASES